MYTARVTSKDNVPFDVYFTARNQAQAERAAQAERQFAATQTAKQLFEMAPDFVPTLLGGSHG